MTQLSPTRIGRITGSRIASILCLPGAHSSRKAVLTSMVAQARGEADVFVGNKGTEWGSDNEAKAVFTYTATNPGAEVYCTGEDQQTIIHPVYDFLAVTPDGFVNDDGLIEVKCPYPMGLYTHISQKPNYQAQILLAMECTGRQWCDFVVWRPLIPADPDDMGYIDQSRMHLDPWWLESVMPKLEKFMGEYRAAIA